MTAVRRVYDFAQLPASKQIPCKARVSGVIWPSIVRGVTGHPLLQRAG
jgi:hypothetical protein